MPAVTVRDATPDDVELLHALVCELAEYEKLRDAVRATSDSMRAALFGPRPYCEALVGEIDGSPAGFALFFHNYSTFAGKPGIYLEGRIARFKHPKQVVFIDALPKTALGKVRREAVRQLVAGHAVTG